MASLVKKCSLNAMLMMRNLEGLSFGSLGTIAPIVAWIASIFTFVYSMIIVFQTFFGEHQPDRLDREAHEASDGMLIAPSILAVLVIGIFFFPNIIGDYLLRPAMTAIYPTIPNVDQLPHQIIGVAWFKIICRFS